MRNLIRAELLKYTSTRMAVGLLVALIFIGAAFAAIMSSALIYGGIEGPGGTNVSARVLLSDLMLVRLVDTFPITIAYVVTLSIGVLVIGQEFRHRTATSTYLAEPRRSRVVLAKAVALSLIALVNGVAHIIGIIAGGAPVFLINDVPLFPEPADLLRSLSLGLLVLVLWALIGLGVGVLITNQVVALVTAIGVVWVVEPLLTLALSFVSWGSDLTRFFPGSLSRAAMDQTAGIPAQVAENLGPPGGGALAWWAAALVLIVYAVAMAVAGLIITRRRDIG